jgi:hypothetical protein
MTMQAIYDDLKQLAGIEKAGTITHHDSGPGIKLKVWLEWGVPCLKGILQGEEAVEQVTVCPPDDPLFSLALWEHLERLNWKVVENATLNIFCATGEGGGVDPTCTKEEIALRGDMPADPIFISTQKKNVEANLKAVEDMKVLAFAAGKAISAGDTIKGLLKIEELEAHPGTPSPKLMDWKQNLVKWIKGKHAEAVNKQLIESPEGKTLKMLADKALDAVKQFPDSHIADIALEDLKAAKASGSLVSIKETMLKAAQQAHAKAISEAQVKKSAQTQTKLPSGSPFEKDKPFVKPALPDPKTLTFVKTLQGSTSPKLMQDANGVKWVVKSGGGAMPKGGTPRKLHVRNEEDANQVYRVLGLAVKQSGIIGEDQVAEYLEEGQPLGAWRNGKTQAQVDAMHKEIRKGFVADALMANWDVIGQDADNIFIHGGKPYRIDNGGALKYRAQGDPKGGDFGTDVPELKTMTSGATNPSATKVFAGITQDEIKNQVQDIVAKKDLILKAISDPDVRLTVEARIGHLASISGWSKEQHPPTGKSLDSGESLANFIKAGMGNLSFSPLFLNKVSVLNPLGTKGQSISIPKVLSKDGNKLQLLKQLLPGIALKQVHITGKTLAEGIQSGKFTFTGKTSSKLKHYANVVSGKNFEHIQVSAQQQASKGVSVNGSVITLTAVTQPPPKKVMQEWANSLTPAEHSAISSWKGSAAAYRISINKGEPTEGAKAFLSAIAKAPARSGTFHRGIHDKNKNDHWATDQAEMFKKAGVGAVVEFDSAPYCTSTDPDKAVGFSYGRFVVTLHGSDFRPILASSVGGYEYEKEHVGKMKAKYRIKRFIENAIINGKQVRYWMELKEV